MALNKETVYRETQQVHQNLHKMDSIVENLLYQHDTLTSHTEEARKIFWTLNEETPFCDETDRNPQFVTKNNTD